MGDEEFAAYEKNKSPTLLWQTWAAKETAFKFLRQKDTSIRFLPRSFVYRYENQTVVHASGIVPMQYGITNEYVHGIGVAQKVPHITAVESMHTVLARHHEDPLQKNALSVAVRLLIREKASALWNKGLDAFEVKKDAHGIPRLFDGKSNYAMSISHHGIYVAVVFVTEKLS